MVLTALHRTLLSTFVAVIAAGCAAPTEEGDEPRDAEEASVDTTTSTSEQALSIDTFGAGILKKKTFCFDFKVPLKIDPASSERQPIGGTYCGSARAKKLIITLHGATYNRMYWDWPQQPQKYNFIRDMTKSGDVAVLNLDRLGAGRSARPISSKVNNAAHAYIVHQLVPVARLAGFKTVLLAGHSLGSGVAMLEAATYHDVDGIVLTGFLHAFASLGFPEALYPAAFDPKFAALNLDMNYLTTQPGKRAIPALYNLAVADPAVMAFDEANKDVATVPDLEGLAALVFDPSVSQAVDVPVLSIVGNYDGGFCTPPSCPEAAAEPAAWSPAAELEVNVIPDAGHNVHLHPKAAGVEFRQIHSWMRRHFR